MDDSYSLSSTAIVYAASANPPRRAKRPRTDELPTIAPAPFSSSSHSAAAEDNVAYGNEEYDQDQPAFNDDGEAIPPPKRRGRKPSTLSRAARESMRRQNHSRIEKARRTKINDALATLRRLVPADDADQGVDDGDFGCREKKKGNQEKEFKLEVLERTVIYVEELQKRVRELEAEANRPASYGRRHVEEDAISTVTSSDRRTQSPAYLSPPLAPASHRTSVSISPATRPSDTSQQPSPLLLPSLSSIPTRPRLPSISTWLPSCVRPPSPALFPERGRVTVLQPQRPPLPTPPTSGTLGPIVSPSNPPTLALEAPVSAPSPPWTPDDESAVNLLLQIRGVSPKHSRVQTPASLLGVRLPKV